MFLVDLPAAFGAEDFESWLSLLKIMARADEMALA